MKSYREALDIVLAEAQNTKLETQILDMEKAQGFTLAEEINAPHDLPSFANSSMDGFALRASETQKASREKPLEFKTLACLWAGKQERVYKPPFAPLEAFEIMTGAPLPHEDFDAVVKIEDVERTPEGFRLFAPLSPGENTRLAGEDFKKGSLVAKKGSLITPELTMALAALGVTKLNVYKKIKVVLLSTGSELLAEPHQKLERGLIRNATLPYLRAALEKRGAEFEAFQLEEENEEGFLKLLNRALKSKPDVVLSTGAVSMGKFDFIPEALKKNAAQIFFHKVAIKPGKPLLFARLKEGPLFFGLPGNPISTAVGLTFFLDPLISTLRAEPIKKPLRFRLKKRIEKKESLRVFYKANISGGEVEVLPGQASFMISSFTKANAWLVLDETTFVLEAGAEGEVYAY